VIDIEQGPVRALEEDATARTEQFMEYPRRVGHHRCQSPPDCRCLRDQRTGQHRGAVRRGCPSAPFGQHRCLELHRDPNSLSQNDRIQQVAHSNGAGTLYLLRICRTDPSARRPDGPGGAAALRLTSAEQVLTNRILDLVVGHHDVCAVGNQEPRRIDALGLKPVDLLDQLPRVDHHAVADHGTLPGIQDARWDQVE
jgi:hypothetical protein